MMAAEKNRVRLDSEPDLRASICAAESGANPITASDRQEQAAQSRWKPGRVSRTSIPFNPFACVVPSMLRWTVGKTVAAEHCFMGLPRWRHSPRATTERVVLSRVRGRGRKLWHHPAPVAMPVQQASPRDARICRRSFVVSGRMRGPAHSGKLARPAVRPNCREAFGWATAGRCSALPPRETLLLSESLSRAAKATRRLRANAEPLQNLPAGKSRPMPPPRSLAVFDAAVREGRAAA